LTIAKDNAVLQKMVKFLQSRHKKGSTLGEKELLGYVAIRYMGPGKKPPSSDVEILLVEVCLDINSGWLGFERRQQPWLSFAVPQ